MNLVENGSQTIERAPNPENTVPSPEGSEPICAYTILTRICYDSSLGQNLGHVG